MPLWLKRSGQKGQRKGRSPVCVLACLSSRKRLLGPLNSRAHTPHCRDGSAATDAAAAAAAVAAEGWLKEATARGEPRAVVRGASALGGSRTLAPRLQRGALWKTVRSL